MIRAYTGAAAPSHRAVPAPCAPSPPPHVAPPVLRAAAAAAPPPCRRAAAAPHRRYAAARCVAAAHRVAAARCVAAPRCVAPPRHVAPPRRVAPSGFPRRRRHQQEHTRSSVVDSDELDTEEAEANHPSNEFQHIIFGSICPVLTVTEVESMHTRDSKDALAFTLNLVELLPRNLNSLLTSGKRGLVLEKPSLLWVSLETIKTSKIQRLPGLPQTQVP